MKLQDVDPFQTPVLSRPVFRAIVLIFDRFLVKMEDFEHFPPGVFKTDRHPGN